MAKAIFSTFVAFLLATSFLLTSPTSAASSGCWTTDVTEQDLAGVGEDRAFLRVEQAMFSADCSAGAAQPWYVYCATGGVDDAPVVTPAIQTVEISVLGITIVEGDEELVASQVIHIPTGADAPALNDQRCSDQPVVVSLVVRGPEGDSVISSDGAVSLGPLPFANEVCSILGEEDCEGALTELHKFIQSVFKAVLGNVINSCENNQPDWFICLGGDGPTGIRLRIQRMIVDL